MWQGDADLVGIDMNTQGQLRLLHDVFPEYVGECPFPTRPTAVPHDFHLGNGWFEALDVEVLYSLIRHFKPVTVIEIGFGNSTMLSAHAALANKEMEGVETKVVCIEPHPHEVLRRGFPGLTELVAKPVERVPLSMFSDLRENDVLFIDSSYVVNLGNDALFEYLEILPRLRPWVLVHIHDVFLPADYPEQWVRGDHKFSKEQYLLQAFLVFNNAFEVLWASSYMSTNYKAELEGKSSRHGKAASSACRRCSGEP